MADEEPKPDAIESTEQQAEPTPEPEPTMPKEAKPIPKKQNISNTQKITDFIKSRIEQGFELKDRNSKLELNKLTRQELKLSKGWSSDINKIIKNVAIEKKIALSELGYKNEVEGITVNLIDDSTESLNESTVHSQQQPPQLAQPHLNPPVHSPRGTLPKTTTEKNEQQTQNTEGEQPPEEKKHLSEDAQKKLIKRGLNDLIAPLYIAIGIIEPDEEEKEEEAKLPTAKKFRKDLDMLGDDINDYLKENNIQLPQFLSHVAILVSIFAVLIVPVLKFKFFSSKQDANPDYDESADDIDVEA